MLRTFEGATEIGGVYEVGMSDTDSSLIILQNALGTAAVAKLAELLSSTDVNERTRQLHEVLYNELPGLLAAEQNTLPWAASQLPRALTFHPSMEGTVFESSGEGTAHIDNVVLQEPAPFVYALFAVSIALEEEATFRAVRFHRDLTQDEIMNGDRTALDSFEAERINDAGKIIAPDATAVQTPGDIIFIPTLIRPSLHGVEAANPSRRALITSYIATIEEQPDFNALRENDMKRIKGRRAASLIMQVLFEQLEDEGDFNQ